MSTPRHPFLDWDGPLPFAHRGGASDVPENTMQAFEYAVNLGYRYLETDVQVTADGVLAAFHDNDLLRTTGRPGKISELPWSEVSKALVDGKAPIPLLEDLLGAWPEARINIDCKSNAAVDALIASLRRTNSLDRVCVAAFSDARLRRLRAALGSALCSSLGPVELGLLRFERPNHFFQQHVNGQANARQGGLQLVAHGRDPIGLESIEQAEPCHIGQQDGGPERVSGRQPRTVAAGFQRPDDAVRHAVR